MMMSARLALMTSALWAIHDDAKQADIDYIGRVGLGDISLGGIDDIGYQLFGNVGFGWGDLHKSKLCALI